ncbi:MAG: DUF2062 domain-containing protein [Pseudomonadales bacterium]|nr:DUF2062 domain-containing protein [Pseudomonadales bacterium]
MPRKLFKRFIPERNRITASGKLSALGEKIHDPNLWHLNKHSVSSAVFIGVFFAFLPLPLQTLSAAFCAVAFRCNLPISITLVWISNPVTIPPLFFFCYRLGAHLLGVPVIDLPNEFDYDVIQNSLRHIGQPLLLGCLLSGIFCASVSYLLVRGFWRWHVIHSWNKRRKRLKPIKNAEKPTTNNMNKNR